MEHGPPVPPPLPPPGTESPPEKQTSGIDAFFERMRGSKGGARQWFSGVTFTAFILSIIALTIKAVAGTLAFVLLGSVVFVVTVFHRVFPGSGFFTLSLVNFIGVYACIFVVIIETNFPTLSQRDRVIGFILPLIAFVSGACARGKTVRHIIVSRRLRHENHISEIFVWLLPMVGMIVLTFFLPADSSGGGPSGTAFLVVMAIVALIVVAVSQDIAVFLLDLGILFEGFFKQAARLVMPAFAFLTFYSLLVIVFAGIYSVIDRFSPSADFMIHGVGRNMTFAESIYFSVVTLSTVGYGDIQPVSALSRFVAIIEIVMGILLLLFGFSAIIRYTPSDSNPLPDATNRPDDVNFSGGRRYRPRSRRRGS